MSPKSLVKTTIVIAGLLLAGLRAAGHPAYLNQYANDPLSKPELRTSCAICHAPEARATEPNFLTEFGRAFKANRFRISPEMREQFTALFDPADRPVAGVPFETVRVSTAQVVINVTVKDAKGKYVSGLDRAAFTLLEDDREQEVLEFLGEDAPLAVAVLIDTSGSALEKDVERYRQAALDLAYRLRPRDALAVYAFGDAGVQQLRDFSTSVQGLKPLLKQLRGRGDTPLYDAILEAANDLRARPERRRVMILLSDGGDSASQATLRATERQTFLAGVSIYAIDLINTQKSARRSPARQAAAQTLRQLAEETGGRYITTEGGFFLLSSRSKLKRIFEDLIDELHTQYTIAYEPANPRQAGRWRTVRVTMEQSDLLARTRLGYREGVQ
jgi:Ca-activated chloride channel family protein